MADGPIERTTGPYSLPTMLTLIRRAMHEHPGDARAILKAMQKPTPGMAEAGGIELGNNEYGHAGFIIDDPTGYGVIPAAKMTWQKMVEKALAEEPDEG